MRTGWIVAGLAAAWPLALSAQRIVLPLDGTWSIADGSEPEAVPADFTHTVPVPGLVHSATPPFPAVDRYLTHDFVYTMKRYGVLPASEKLDGLGRMNRPNRSVTVAARKHGCLFAGACPAAAVSER